MRIKSGGYLTFYMPGKRRSIQVRLTAPVPLKDLLAGLNIPLAEVNLAAINGKMIDNLEVLVSDSDIVNIFSSVNGG